MRLTKNMEQALRAAAERPDQTVRGSGDGFSTTRPTLRALKSRGLIDASCRLTDAGRAELSY